MRSGGLTERYVKALSGMELPKGLTLEKLHEEIAAYAEVYEHGAELREVLENPFFGDEQRKALIATLAATWKVSSVCRNVISLLVDKKRTRLLPDIARDLGRLLDERSGVARALVTSATPLKKKQVGDLTKVLAELRGSPVRVEQEVDSALVGGLVIEMEGRVYDGSIKKRLDSIRALILSAN